jgi:uncharacterized protein with GYD domain
MPLYVTLIKLTDQGAKTGKESPKRAKETIPRIEKLLGGKTLQTLYTMGEYDMVVITEAKDDESAVAGSYALSSGGNARTTTLRAFTVEEMERIASRLP